MALHLIKLCVGVDTIEELEDWIVRRRAMKLAAGDDPRHAHVTRMQPRRASELLDGGSLFWVIKGNIQARQKLIDIEPFIDSEGTERCRLVLESKIFHTCWQPRRPFQGWRYLKAEDAPTDLPSYEEGNSLPAKLQGELANLGLL